MRREPSVTRSFAPTLLILLLVGTLLMGCSSLPGLRVLTGEDTSTTSANRVVQSIDLAMADKTSRTDPALIEAGTRIEAADPYVDIIEIRPIVNDNAQHVFSVNLIYRPPQTDNTTQGRIDAAEQMRRLIELAWQGTLPQSTESDILSVSIYSPSQVMTLDNGLSNIGVLLASAQIDRSQAVAYLQGTRSLETFYGMIVNGTLAYDAPSDLQLYEGIPNHPMFMVPDIQTTTRNP
ncbi:MAG: hypothetical protein U0670_06990 [Anaerolineae bacterium]